MKKINWYFKDIDIKVIVKNFLLKKKKAINFFILKHFKNSLLIIALSTHILDKARIEYKFLITPRDTKHTFLEVAVIKELSKVTKHKIMVT